MGIPSPQRAFWFLSTLGLLLGSVASVPVQAEEQPGVQGDPNGDVLIIRTGIGTDFSINDGSTNNNTKPARISCKADLRGGAGSTKGLLIVTLKNDAGGTAPAGSSHRWSVGAVSATGLFRLRAPLAIGQQIVAFSGLVAKPSNLAAGPQGCLIGTL